MMATKDIRPVFDAGFKERADGVFIVNKDGTVFDFRTLIGGDGGGGGGGGVVTPASLPKMINRSGVLEGGRLDFSDPGNPVAIPAVPVTVVDANPDRREGGILINLIQGIDPPVLIWCKWVVNPGDVAKAPYYDPDLNRTVFDPGSFYLGPGDQLSIDSQQALSIVVDSGGTYPFACYEAVEA